MSRLGKQLNAGEEGFRIRGCEPLGRSEVRYGGASTSVPVFKKEDLRHFGVRLCILGPSKGDLASDAKLRSYAQWVLGKELARMREIYERIGMEIWTDHAGPDASIKLDIQGRVVPSGSGAQDVVHLCRTPYAPRDVTATLRVGEVDFRYHAEEDWRLLTTKVGRVPGSASTVLVFYVEQIIGNGGEHYEGAFHPSHHVIVTKRLGSPGNWLDGPTSLAHEVGHALTPQVSNAHTGAHYQQPNPPDGKYECLHLMEHARSCMQACADRSKTNGDCVAQHVTNGNYQGTAYALNTVWNAKDAKGYNYYELMRSSSYVGSYK